jgi:hypothetical protein
MPRFYCHLSAPDEFFPDKIGWDVSDLAAAHKRAVRLADRVMRVSALADHGPDWRQWNVQIVDDNAQRVMTVMFPPCPVHEEQAREPEPKGARALLRHLERALDGGNVLPLRRRQMP